MKKLKQKNKVNKRRGSILAFSLIILFIMFSIAASMSVVTVLEKNSASSSQSSSQSLQASDSGSQIAIKKINSVLFTRNSKIKDAFKAPDQPCDDSSGVAVVKNNTDLGSTMPYDLYFYSQDGSPITSCNAQSSEIKNIKSVGTYKNTARAVMVGLNICGNDIPDRNFATNGIRYKAVLAEDGNCWLDRNLGATTTNNDESGYGWLFQWGRMADGHQILGSQIAAGPVASSVVAPPNDNKFLNTNVGDFDWLNPKNDRLWDGVDSANNPCPTGYRLPKVEGSVNEWKNLIDSAGIDSPAKAYASALKLPAGGYRDRGNGVRYFNGQSAYYWSGSSHAVYAFFLYISSSKVDATDYTHRNNAFSVRCIKD